MKIEPLKSLKPFKNKREYVELLTDEGKPITDVVSICTYLDGVVVGTKHGLFTNVKELLN